MKADDLADLLAAQPAPGVTFRQGVVQTWNTGTGANTITVAGVTLTNVPVLSAAVAGLAAGDVIALITWQSSWLILGKITAP
jgi:hypothetical protein